MITWVTSAELRELRSIAKQVRDLRELDQAIYEVGHGLDLTDDGDASYHHCYVRPLYDEHSALMRQLFPSPWSKEDGDDE